MRQHRVPGNVSRNVSNDLNRAHESIQWLANRTSDQLGNPRTRNCFMSFVDPVTLQVIQARLAGIVQRCGARCFALAIRQLSASPRMPAAPIFNPAGEVVAQHVVLRLRMGAFPACAAGLLKSYAARRFTRATPSSPTIPISAAVPMRRIWRC